MRQVYAERLSALMESAREHLRGVLDLSDVQAGLQTTAELRVRVLDEEVAEEAAKRNVEVTPLIRYATGSWQPYTLQLGFAAIDVEEIRRGVRDLAIVIEELRAARRD
jgi:GntR family transcriptional regulator/MocR family aminotransferase